MHGVFYLIGLTRGRSRRLNLVAYKRMRTMT